MLQDLNGYALQPTSIKRSNIFQLDLVFKEIAGYDALVAEIVDTFLLLLTRYEKTSLYLLPFHLV